MRRISNLLGIALLSCFLSELASLPQQTVSEQEIDWQKLQDINQKRQQGLSLTPAESEYLQFAEGWMRKRTEEFRATSPPRESTGLVPLVDLKSGSYKGEQGGLYPGGSNAPPREHQKAGLEAAAGIVPRDTSGQPSRDGKIVLVSIGMSNTTQEFQVFQKLASADPDLNPRLVLVDGAQGGQAADVTADPRSRFWGVLDQRLSAAGVSRQQVQAVWLKQAIRVPSRPFPLEAKKLQEYIRATIHNLQNSFPNLKIAYLSSRIYAGYATTPLNPEPHAYETAFAVKWVIADQIGGKPELNFVSGRGPVRAPWLAWGPYLWADGIKRSSEGLVYTRDDLAGDGTHPSPQGREKVARRLLSFFKRERTARSWFVSPAAGPGAPLGDQALEALR